MIFITVGSQKFQFNRLLKKIDKLINEKIITEKVIAQIGYSDYKPKNYEYYDFLSREVFVEYMSKTDLVITHAGTGAIITALKAEKKVIAIPRLAKYSEHVDDHQIQLVNEFKQLGLIEAVYEISELKQALMNVKQNKYKKYISNTDSVLESIEKFISEERL